MFEGLAISDLGASGLVVVLVLLVFLGRIVPRRTHQDVIDDREEWRRAYQVSEQARAEQARQLDALLDTTRTTQALLQALRQESDR